jgi:hypothetical protein
MKGREIISEGHDISASAAIICRHCAVEGKTVLRAQRDEPIVPEDTGWQFNCGADGHDESDGMVLSIAEVAKLDGSIDQILDHPARSSFVRRNAASNWLRIN